MSNLLEKASILTTPTAYDNGKILSVKPAPSLGNEQITNGNFDTNSGWNLGSGITISGGSANFTGVANANINQSAGLITGKTYKIVFTVSNYVSGNIDYNVGGNTRQGEISANGTYTVYVVSDSGQIFYFQSDQTLGFTGSIDNVSVKQVIDGDFDFTRNSSATRVNSQGLIEDVQILSSNLVQNGDFSQEGSEEVTNGDFATDSDWSLGSGWSIGDGVAVSDGSSGYSFLQQTSSVLNGKTYKVSYSVTSYTSGSVEVGVGGASNNNIQRNSVGDFVEYHTSNGTNLTIISRNFIGSIDNVSVKEVGQDWTLGTGWSIGASVATVDNTVNANLDQFISGFSGKKVRVSFEISDLSSGGILVGDIVNPGAYNATSNGIHTFDYTATNPTFRVRAYGNPCSITNISVVEITDDTNLPRIDYDRV